MLMLEPTVTEIMESPVLTVPTAKSLRTAAIRLEAESVGSLVVCANDEPIGIITEADITKAVADGMDPDSTAVEQVMADSPVTVAEDDSLSTAATLMRNNDVKRLPVTDDGGYLVGVVTTTDLSHYLPHIVRAGGEQERAEGQSRSNIRVDTAYERDDWSHEYFSDESGIEIGDTSTFSKTLSADDIESFAEITGDTNRLHLDDEYAEQTRFGERIAHGTLVSGLISAALARLPGLVIYLSQDLTFLGPVPLETAVTARCEVVEQVATNQYRLTTMVDRPDGETVIHGEAVVIADAIPET